MKTSVWVFILAGVTWVVALFSIFPLLESANRNEWFGVGIYQVLLTIGWASFFVIAFLSGLIVRSRFRSSYDTFRKALRVSILGTTVIVLFGIIKSQADFNKWDEESESRRVVEEQAAARKFMSAADSLKRVIISSDSSLAEPFYHLGLMYRHQGRWEESVENYKVAIALDPNVSSYFSELGYSESIIGRYDQAVKAYQSAYKLDSSEWNLRELERCEYLKTSRASD